MTKVERDQLAGLVADWLSAVNEVGRLRTNFCAAQQALHDAEARAAAKLDRLKPLGRVSETQLERCLSVNVPHEGACTLLFTWKDGGVACRRLAVEN